MLPLQNRDPRSENTPLTQLLVTKFIQMLLGHRVHPKTGIMLMNVRWIGWGREGDSEEPVHNLVEDDPHRVEECLSHHRDDDDCGRCLEE